MTEILLSELYQKSADEMGAAALLGIESAHADTDCFSVTMEVTEQHLNTQGTVHGGILYTLCDQAVGAYIAYQKRQGVGTEGSIRYYRPACKGDVLTATAFERKSGKTIGVYWVELRNREQTLLADAIFSAMYLA